MLLLLPIIPFRIAQNFYMLFLIYSHADHLLFLYSIILWIFIVSVLVANKSVHLAWLRLILSETSLISSWDTAI